MNSPMLLAVLVNNSPVESVAKTFGVNWSHLSAQVISFSIVCAILYRFAYRPILKMLDERRNQIAQGLSDSEAIRAELARTEAQRHEVLLRAHEQARSLIEEAREAAARLREEEIQKTHAASEQILSHARELAGREHEHMLAELKQEVGGLVVKTTAAVAHKVLTSEDQRRLVEEATRHLAA